VVSLSRVWKPRHHAAAQALVPAKPETTACLAVLCSPQRVEVRTCCSAQCATASRYSVHACESEVVSMVLGRGCTLAVERAPCSTPLPIVALPATANAATVSAMPLGWARPVARDKEVLDATAIRRITQ
jgi:hypothetical protein